MVLLNFNSKAWFQDFVNKCIFLVRVYAFLVYFMLHPYMFTFSKQQIILHKILSYEYYYK